MDIKQPYLSSIQYQQLKLDLLRLDAIHPLLSGNKYYKLNHHLPYIGNKTIVTLGGAYSNHLHATAWWAHANGLSSIGLVRGEEVHNPTLDDCMKYGMRIQFIPRSDWDEIHSDNYRNYVDTENCYFIDLGGRGYAPNAFHEIAHFLEKPYDELYTSVGTGTTLIGISKYTNEKTRLIGFTKIQDKELRSYLEQQIERPFECIQSNGFGKITDEIRQFILDFYAETSVILDPIYTAPMIQHIHTKGAFSDQKILAIHTGGLQGMRSDTVLWNKFADKLVF